jgi:hypothetical protein
MRASMSQNRLAMIPDQTQYDILLSPVLVATAFPCLSGVTGSRSWEGEVRHAPDSCTRFR